MYKTHTCTYLDPWSGHSASPCDGLGHSQQWSRARELIPRVALPLRVQIQGGSPPEQCAFLMGDAFPSSGIRAQIDMCVCLFSKNMMGC